MVLIIEGSHND